MSYSHAILIVEFAGEKQSRVFELLKLQQSFFPDCGNGYHFWAAHATLLIDEPNMILKALPIVGENFKPFTARIESVALYEFFPARFINECKLNHTV